MKDIVKRFPGVLANDHVTFEVEEGEIHGLLGENGAGKSTLMNVLSGLYHADGGEIQLAGRPVTFASSRDALAAGIGMVHQHFMLIPRFTVAENLTLGAEVVQRGFLDGARTDQMVRDLARTYGLKVDPGARVEDISVGTQQRVEILKALYRGAKIIILDEPTAVLTPQEVDELYVTLNGLRASGHTLIFISHKLNEILRITDRVTVLRDGKVVGVKRTAETNAAELARMMVGRDVLLRVEKPPHEPGQAVLKVEGLSVRENRGLPAVRDVSLTVRAGEIVGLAGVEGNGQTQLVEALTGLRRPTGGRVLLNGRDISEWPAGKRFQDGLAHIPEDRHARAMILEFSVAENFALGFQDDPKFTRGPILNRKRISEFAEAQMRAFDVRAPNSAVMGGALSGGNQQKMVVAREFGRQPRLLIAAQPTRGVDVGAIEFIHQQLLKAREAGAAVLLVSLELSEIMSLSDRILVMFEGRIVGEREPAAATDAEIGLLMTGGGAHE